MRKGIALISKVSTAFIVMGMASLAACGKKSDKDSKPVATLTAPDMTSLDLNGEMLAIFPVGSLALGLTNTTYDSPCKNDLNGSGDPTGPLYGTVECAVAKLLADPDKYTNVGQEGFMESLALFTRVFKLSLNNCTDPFSEAEKAITVPVIGEAVEMACGRKPTAAEFAANIKAGMPAMFENVTVEQLASEFSNVNIPLLWGQTKSEKNILAVMQMPPKDADGGEERAAWWYSKKIATGTVTLKSVMFKDDASNRRYLTGNPETHEFTFNYLWHQNNSSRAFRGTGFSEGEGKFYLIQAKIHGGLTSGGSELDGTTVLDFCFTADTKTKVDVSNCAAFKTKLESETAFFTPAELPDENADIPLPQL